MTKYVYGLGLIGEEKQDLPFKVYHFDYRGSTAAITDVTGYVTDRFEYDTYGRQTEHTGSSFVIFGYNGRDGVVTDNNGLIYMRARYYKPELRRFVNADVVAGSIAKAVTLNRYAYANGNPVSLIDPFGLSAERGGTDLNEVDPYIRRLAIEAGVSYEDAILIYRTQLQKMKEGLDNGLLMGLEIIQRELSKVDLTYSSGFGVTITIGIVSYGVQGGWSIDTEGNIVIQGSFVGNFTTSGPLGASAYMYETITNAPNVDKLTGEGYQLGVSGGIPTPYVPVLVGGDVNIIPDSLEDNTYFGLTGSGGIGSSVELEAHAGLSETANWNEMKFNAFELAYLLIRLVLGE